MHFSTVGYLEHSLNFMSWDSSLCCIYQWFIQCHCCRIIQFLHMCIYLHILLFMALGLSAVGPPTKTSAMGILRVHVWTLSARYMSACGIVRSWGMYIVNITRYHQMVFQSTFASSYFHPAVYENSSCDLSIPIPDPFAWWLKTLLTWFSKTRWAVKSMLFYFKNQKLFIKEKVITFD